MFLLVGLSMAGVGGLTVYGSLTGRLAAILAAVFKPSDLGVAGSTVNGTPDIGTNAANPADSAQLLLAALIRQFNETIKPFHPEAVAEFDRTVKPLIQKARKGNEADYLKAIQALRNLIAKYVVPHGPGGTATQGGSTDPDAGRPPIVAPPVNPTTPTGDSQSGLGDLLGGTQSHRRLSLTKG